MGLLSTGDRWDLTVAAFQGSHWASEDSVLGTDFGIAVAQRPTKLFSAGDVAILYWLNGGGERQPCFCRSQRGYTVSDLYVPYARYAWRKTGKSDRGAKGEFVQYTNRTVFKIVEHPGELNGLRSGHPAVRQFVVDLQLAGGAATRVGECSPGTLSQKDGL